MLPSIELTSESKCYCQKKLHNCAFKELSCIRQQNRPTSHVSSLSTCCNLLSVGQDYYELHCQFVLGTFTVNILLWPNCMYISVNRYSYCQEVYILINFACCQYMLDDANVHVLYSSSDNTVLWPVLSVDTADILTVNTRVPLFKQSNWKGHFSSPKRPDPVWNPHSLQYKVYRG